MERRKRPFYAPGCNPRGDRPRDRTLTLYLPPSDTPDGTFPALWIENAPPVWQRDGFRPEKRIDRRRNPSSESRSDAGVPRGPISARKNRRAGGGTSSLREREDLAGGETRVSGKRRDLSAADLLVRLPIGSCQRRKPFSKRRKACASGATASRGEKANVPNGAMASRGEKAHLRPAQARLGTFGHPSHVPQPHLDTEKRPCQRQHSISVPRSRRANGATRSRNREGAAPFTKGTFSPREGVEPKRDC